MTDLQKSMKGVEMRVLFDKMHSFFAKQQWEECAHTCTELLSMMDEEGSVPDDAKVEIYRIRGISYHRMDLYSPALADLATVLELLPDSAANYDYRGIVHSDKGDIDLAIADFDKALELDSKFGHSYNNRGNAYTKRDEFDRAIADYTKAVEIEPGNSDFRNNRALAYLKKGDYDSATADCDEVLKNDPKNGIASRTRALAFVAKKQSETHEKYQDQLGKQQKQFEEKLKQTISEYDLNLLRIDEYKARKEEFQEKAEETGKILEKEFRTLRRTAASAFLLVLGIILIYMFGGNIHINLGESYEIWLIFPLITAAGLFSFPFIWKIRTLKQEKARLLALSHDAPHQRHIGEPDQCEYRHGNSKRIAAKILRLPRRTQQCATHH